MSWQQPKTDWEARYDENGVYLGDYFEAVDYNRISDNSYYLAQMYLQLYLKLPGVSVIFYHPAEGEEASAGMFQSLENQLTFFAETGYDPGIPERKEWVVNQSAPTYDDINRIEKSQLMLYNMATRQIAAQPKLELKLNGGLFG